MVNPLFLSFVLSGKMLCIQKYGVMVRVRYLQVEDSCLRKHHLPRSSALGLVQHFLHKSVPRSAIHHVKYVLGRLGLQGHIKARFL